MLPDVEAHDAHIRRPQSPGVGGNVRGDHVLPISRAAKLGPPKASRQHGAFSEDALLHHRFFAVDVPRQPTIPRAHCARIGPADVRCEEYDGRVRSQPRPIPDRGQHISRPHVHEGGGRADGQRADKELQLLC